MILLNKYNEFMERIEVTPQMYERISKHIRDISLNEVSYKSKTSFPYKRILYLAASFLFLFIGVFALKNVIGIKPQQPELSNMPNIEEHNTIHELSSSVGFQVQEVQQLPFEAEKIQYVSYDKNMAEITYSNQKNKLVFRMSTGSQDISRDYTEYTDVKKGLKDTYNVTIKGEKGRYKLAIWYRKGYSYSIQIDSGISETDILDLVKSVR
jgi:hypothetical protein